MPDTKNKCQKCLKINCRTCFKMEKMTPKETAVLDEMKENIEQTVLPDKTIKYSIKYVTYRDLKYTFPPNLSNFSEALIQSKNNFKNFLKFREA